MPAICPFLYAADHVRIAVDSQQFPNSIPGHVVNPQDIHCLESRCAIWNEGQGKCNLAVEPD